MFLTRSLKQGAKGTVTFFISFWISSAFLFAAAAAPDLPPDIAKVEKTEAGTNGKTVFLIQEAHVDYNAQKAISEILKNLVQKENLRLILVEGGWGDMGLSFVEDGRSAKEHLELAEKYLSEGKISGEEYLNITSDLNMLIWGIENPDHYRENMEAFLKFHDIQNQLLAEIQKLKEALAPLRDKIFSPAAKEFEAERRAFRENQNTLIHYSHFLRNKVDAQVFESPSYPQLKQLMALEGMEQSFDPDKVEHEKQEVIRALSKTVPRLEFDRLALLKERKNPNDELQLIQALLNLCKSYQNKLPNLSVKNLTRYSEIMENLLQNDTAAIFNEIKTLESEGFKKLTLSSDEQSLFELIDSVEMLEKLFQLEMSPDDIEWFDQKASSLTPLAWKNLFPLPLEGGEGKGEGVDFAFLNKWIPDAKAFYHSAMNREKALIRNAIQKIKETQVSQAAILAGGFHTEHLAKAFKEHGFSYILISPRFEPENPETHQQKYFEILKTNWNQILESNSIVKKGEVLTHS